MLSGRLLFVFLFQLDWFDHIRVGAGTGRTSVRFMNMMTMLFRIENSLPAGEVFVAYVDVITRTSQPDGVAPGSKFSPGFASRRVNVRRWASARSLY